PCQQPRELEIEVQAFDGVGLAHTFAGLDEQVERALLAAAAHRDLAQRLQRPARGISVTRGLCRAQPRAECLLGLVVPLERDQKLGVHRSTLEHSEHCAEKHDEACQGGVGQLSATLLRSNTGASESSVEGVRSAASSNASSAASARPSRLRNLPY